MANEPSEQYETPDIIFTMALLDRGDVGHYDVEVEIAGRRPIVAADWAAAAAAMLRHAAQELSSDHNMGLEEAIEVVTTKALTKPKPRTG